MKSISMIAIGLLVVLFVAGCQTQNQQQNAASAGPLKEFSMTARQWSFEPSTITVNQGDRVRLSINNVDVPHGIAIPAFNVRENLQPGKATVVEFVADRKGAFPFSCSVYCGDGHGQMTGQIVVN